MNIKCSASQSCLCILLTVFIFGSFCTVKAQNDSRSIEQVEDSLVNILKTMPRDTAYLDMISAIEQLLMGSPRFLYYAELKEKEARLLNNARYICGSMSDRAIYYSNREMTDSFYYWKEKMEPLALEAKEYNYYFFLCNLEVASLIREGKIELAMQTANRMYDTAKNLNSQEGLAAANLSIGRALLSARKYKEAIVSYETALSLMDKSNVRFNAWRMQAYNYLVLLCDMTDESEKGLKIAAEQEELIKLLQASHVGQNGTGTYMLNGWVELQLKKASFHLKQCQPEQALRALNDAKRNYAEVDGKVRLHYHLIYASYYEEKSQYDRALDELNIFFSDTARADEINESQIMEQKARLLERLGYKDEAIRLYKEILTYKDLATNKWFDSQLNELRTIYDTDHLKLRNKELELKNKHTQLQAISLFLGITLLVLIVILLFFFRLSRLKKKLEFSEKRLLADKELLIRTGRELRIAKENAEEARDIALKAERKESFMANMSHEIRTPLNAIVGFSNLLVSEEEVDPDERKLIISTINQNCDLLLKLIGDILDLSRMESGKMSFKREDCNLTELMEEVYMTHKMMIPVGVEFLKAFPEIPAFAHTDRGRIKQVITNFISNAVKFTTSGHIKIGYEVDVEEYRVSMFVEDTGKGIPEELQAKIFERFCKQDEFDKGTGLGLSICTVIAEKLDGRLTIKSKPGEGSRFGIEIPYLR